MFDEYPDILSIIDVMEILGIGRNLALRLCKEGVIPAFKVGRNWRINKTELIKYTSGRKHL